MGRKIFEKPLPSAARPPFRDLLVKTVTYTRKGKGIDQASGSLGWTVLIVDFEGVRLTSIRQEKKLWLTIHFEL